MGYTIEAFVAGPGAAAVLAEGLGAGPVALGQGLQLVPLLPAGSARPPSSFGPDLWQLTREAEELAGDAARHGSVAYVEAEYFGGVGEQHAVVWQDGGARLLASELPGAVNEALRALGAVRVASASTGVLEDEFDSVGLGRHRSTQDWTA